LTLKSSHPGSLTLKSTLPGDVHKPKDKSVSGGKSSPRA
jgi:hypothetical protein